MKLIILYSFNKIFEKTKRGFIKVNYLINKEQLDMLFKENIKLYSQDIVILKNKINTIKNDIYRFIKIYKKNFKKFNFLNNKNNLKLLKINKYYIQYYFNKNNFIKNKKYIIYRNYGILIVNILHQKPVINLIVNNKLALTLTSGIIKNKLGIKEKNIKKSQKMLKLMVKILSFNIKKIYEIKNFVIQIKGVKNKLSYIITFLNRYFNPKKKFFLFTPTIIDNKIKFKKIKSIKRKLRKKFIKIN